MAKKLKKKKKRSAPAKKRAGKTPRRKRPAKNAARRVLKHKNAARRILKHKKAVRRVLKHKKAVRRVLKHKKAVRRVLKHKKAVRKAPLKRKKSAKKQQLKKLPLMIKKGDIIGVVTHYFPKVRAAVVKVNKSMVVGQGIRIKGHTTNFAQMVTSMQIDRVPINAAKKGQEIGLQVESRVRRNDVVLPG